MRRPEADRLRIATVAQQLDGEYDEQVPIDVLAAEIERLCQCVSDLTRENKSLRKKSQEETIAELRQEIEELNEQLDKYVYGI